MDKIPRIASALLSEDRNIVTNSFDRHKKYFLEPKRIPYALNEEYAKLIRESTEWFDMSLVLARDKLVTHGGTYGIALTRRRKTGGIRMDKIKISEDLTKEAHQIIGIKKSMKTNTLI